MRGPAKRSSLRLTAAIGLVYQAGLTCPQVLALPGFGPPELIWLSLFGAFALLMQYGSILCRRTIGSFNVVYKPNLYPYDNLLQ